MMLRRVTQVDRGRRDPVDAATLAAASEIVEDVRVRGLDALREYAERFGDIGPGESLTRPSEDCAAALESIPVEQRDLLFRTAERIRAFSEAQEACLTELTCGIPGGEAGHWIAPVERAGCYAPGGRYPLPSSVLMTAITARVAGVREVWVASPRPSPVTLAAAAIAKADGVLAVGGAQAIAALAFGVMVPECDIIVGPGNRWVTAAKKLVSGRVAIDMLAGPSELVVLADDSSDASVIAADLLAQAEHDTDAMPILISLDLALADRVDEELVRQLADLPTTETALAALANGYCFVAPDIDSAIEAVDRIAPEHLELHLRDAAFVALYLKNYGGLFLGSSTAEVFGDYGAGPNHVLPTGGTSRYTGGLSVFSFLRVRTWMRIDDPNALASDAADLARMEGLEAHARSAELRQGSP